MNDVARSISSTGLQQMLQLAVQSVQWTYSIFWRLCPRQGILVWGDGYYNGVIKTRKTVQTVEVSTEEACLQRSQQLRELYDALSTGEANQQAARRPCTALSPEDLTESEWFYLMCVSFSFPHGVGLPGRAFERRRPVWLTHADESDSKVFSRAILAKSACIQTVVCIPLVHGVLELGTTENVEEDMELIQLAKSFFTYQHDHRPRPALSEHSASNSMAQNSDQHMFHLQPTPPIPQPETLDPHELNHENENDGDTDGDSVYEDDDVEVGIDTESQNEMSEGLQLGSLDDCSNSLDAEIQILMAGNTSSSQSDHLHPQYNSNRAWHPVHEELCSGFPKSSVSAEDAHYSETVSVILNSNLRRSEQNTLTQLAQSRRSIFSTWSYEDHILNPISYEGTSQWLLKNILFRVPNLHFKDKIGNSPRLEVGEGGNRFRKGTPQEELSANHVLAERRRREKLNERFIILRSLVPFVTKVDKASILGDTIEYVKQLKRRIQELESRNKITESDQKCKARVHNTRKLRVVEHRKLTESKSTTITVEALSSSVQVSIIDNNALIELQCPYRERLLMHIMQTLDQLKLEITSIKSSSVNGMLSAQLQAKVKDIDKKKASIVEVEKAIYQVFSQ